MKGCKGVQCEYDTKVMRARVSPSGWSVIPLTHCLASLSAARRARGAPVTDVQLFIYAQVHSASVARRAELRFSPLIWDHST